MTPMTNPGGQKMPDTVDYLKNKVCEKSWPITVARAEITFGPIGDPCNYECDDDYEYTHWMPHPTPPTEGEG